MAFATSSADTSRPIACRASRAARSATGSAAFCSIRSTQGVAAVPGRTQFTRISSRTWSTARA